MGAVRQALDPQRCVLPRCFGERPQAGVVAADPGGGDKPRRLFLPLEDVDRREGDVRLVGAKRLHADAAGLVGGHRRQETAGKIGEQALATTGDHPLGRLGGDAQDVGHAAVERRHGTEGEADMAFFAPAVAPNVQRQVARLHLVAGLDDAA